MSDLLNTYPIKTLNKYPIKPETNITNETEYKLNLRPPPSASGGVPTTTENITHTQSTAPGDGDCFFSSIYRCLNDANLLGKLDQCFSSYNPSIVLDANLTETEKQYIKALRQMCTQSDDWIAEWGKFYDEFIKYEYLMCTTIIDVLPRLQLGAMGFTLTDQGINEQNIGHFNIVSNNIPIGKIEYEFDIMNFSIDQNSYEMSPELLKKIKTNLVERPIFLQNIKKITEYSETNKPWATQFEIEFLTKKLKKCGKISIVVKTNFTKSQMSQPQPIMDQERNQIIYLQNEDEKHYVPYLRNTPGLSPSAKSGGGAQMPSEWSCATCTFSNNPNSKFCEMCKTTKMGGSRRKRRQKRKSAKKRKSRKSRTRRTTSRSN